MHFSKKPNITRTSRELFTYRRRSDWVNSWFLSHLKLSFVSLETVIFPHIRCSSQWFICLSTSLLWLNAQLLNLSLLFLWRQPLSEKSWTLSLQGTPVRCMDRAFKEWHLDLQNRVANWISGLGKGSRYLQCPSVHRAWLQAGSLCSNSRSEGKSRVTRLFPWQHGNLIFSWTWLVWYLSREWLGKMRNTEVPGVSP